METLIEVSRDLAIVLLALEISIFVFATGAALYFAIRGIRAVKRWIRMPLLNAQVWALRIQNAAEQGSDAIVEIPIAAESAGVRLRATVRAFGDFLMGRLDTL